ncbi:hypothetical protein Sango_2697200 [Sesamum angolense]|uniref:Aminotransferase-like plant mobile domain-containing protein n=1 Tax=Sesamum angolense TaxID=2727404 RepID=A0AAE1W2Y0_9LAMI|nr:hypothetical protein Sango_2697200 [Sesamum angolense]
MDFEDRTEPFPSIVIRSGKDKFKVKGTSLCVHEPTNADAEFTLPNRYLAATGPSWRTPQSKYDEVSFYPNYWEWTEDCSATMQTSSTLPKFMQLCTHLFSRTSATSMSFKHFLSYGGASLRTLSMPPLENIHLFVGYLWTLRFAYSDGVLISNWIDFWFKGPLCYAAPPLRSSRKRVHEPKLSHNPSRDVDASNLRKDHVEPFTILQILVDIRDKTYVAAFLSYWLCSFVLPYIKAGKTHFPPKFEPIKAQMVKYTGENMARHFEPTEEWSPLLKLIVPHHFSHQFSFCQDVLGSLKKEILTCSLKELGQLCENDVISALSILNGQLSNPQTLEKVSDLYTISMNSSFFHGVPSSFMPLNKLVLYEESLSLAKDDLFAAEAKEKEHVNEVESLEAEIVQALINFRKEVATKKEKISILENTTYRSEAEVEALEKMETLLEESKRDLTNFNLFA